MRPSAFVLLMVVCWTVALLGLPRSRVRIWVGWNVHIKEVKWRSRCVKEASWSDAFFLGELKAGVFKFKDIQTSEVSAKFDRPHGWDWRSFLVNREFVDPLATGALNTTFNVVRAKEEFLNFRCFEFVIIPNSKVCWGQDALAVGDDLAVHFFLVAVCIAQHALEEL